METTMTIAGALLTLAIPAPAGYLPSQLADRASQWWQIPDQAGRSYGVEWRQIAARPSPQSLDEELELALFGNPFADEDANLADAHELRMAAEDNLDLA